MATIKRKNLAAEFLRASVSTLHAGERSVYAGFVGASPVQHAARLLDFDDRCVLRSRVNPQYNKNITHPGRFSIQYPLYIYFKTLSLNFSVYYVFFLV